MIDGRNFFDQPVKISLRTYDNIGKISTGQRDDYTTICLLDYPYLKVYYKQIATELSKQQKLYANLKVIKQLSFTGNLKRDADTQFFSLLKKGKKQF